MGASDERNIALGKPLSPRGCGSGGRCIDDRLASLGGVGRRLTRPGWPCGMLAWSCLPLRLLLFLCVHMAPCAGVWTGARRLGIPPLDPPRGRVVAYCLRVRLGGWWRCLPPQFGDARFHQQTLDAIAEACSHLLDALLLVGL